MKKSLMIMLFLFFVLVISGCSKSNTSDEIELEEISGEKTVNNPINQQIINSETKKETINLAEEISQKIKNGLTKDYKVLYDISNEEFPNTFMGWYIMDESIRIDSDFSDLKSRMISHDDNSYVCYSNGEYWTCFRATAEDQIEGFEDNRVKISDEINLSYNIELDGSMYISRHKADCYKFFNNNVSQKICLSEEGIIFYLEFEDKIMKAIEYSTKVTDADFELPEGATLTDLKGPNTT